MLQLRTEDRFALFAAPLSMTNLRVPGRDAGHYLLEIPDCFSILRGDLALSTATEIPCDNSDDSPGIP